MLSDQDLLLLSNFMYANISVQNDGRSIAEILEIYSNNGVVTADNLSTVNITGGIKKDQLADIMNEMKSSEAIMNLTINSSINDGIRGACFVNDSTNEAVVAFRGTGGEYSQWKSNFYAMSEVSVKEQEQAARFVESVANNYDRITTTGHSKGGNLAMYATVVLGGLVDRCVSYSGQGFSKQFITEYAGQIAENSSRITSIGSYVDPINALMHSVAGRNMYVNTGDSIFSHSSYELYKSSEFNRNGRLVSSPIITPKEYISLINTISVGLTNASTIPRFGPKVKYGVNQLGVIVALGFELSREQSNQERIDDLALALYDMMKNRLDLFLNLAGIGRMFDMLVNMLFVKEDVNAQQDEASGDGFPYVVRGAGIFCTYGSHLRRLDMPVCHGVYIRGKPVMNEQDCKVGLDANIPSFGACQAPGNPNQQIIIKDPTGMMPIVGKNGEPSAPTMPVTGALCTPILGEKWLNAYKDTLIDGVPALRTNCSIACIYQGVIYFHNDGQFD